MTQLEMNMLCGYPIFKRPGIAMPAAAASLFFACMAHAEPTGCPDFAVAPPRPANEIVVKAADFGFSAAGDKNASAINRALAEAKRTGAARVELAPGTYRCFDEPGISIDGFSDFTFDGRGALLVFRRAPEFRGQPQSELIHDKGNLLVKDCERCVVGFEESRTTTIGLKDTAIKRR